MGGFWVVLGRLGGGLKKLCGPISKDLMRNAGKGWEELGRIGTAGQKVGESFGKLKKAWLITRLSIAALSVPPLGQV